MSTIQQTNVIDVLIIGTDNATKQQKIILGDDDECGIYYGGGGLNIKNTDTANDIIFTLGNTDATTLFDIKNSDNASKFNVDGTGKVTITGDLSVTGDLTTNSLINNTTADGNTAVGFRTMQGNTTGAFNTALGYNALNDNTTATDNTAIGRNAGTVATGSNNTFAGSGAGDAQTSGNNNIILGYNADGSSTTVSNEITLGNTAITKFRIPGINFVIKDTTATENYVLTVDSSGEAGWEAAAGGDVTLTGSQTLTNKTLTSPALTTPTVTTAITLNAQADLRFADADSSNWLAFQAPNTVGSNVTWTLPATDGTEDQVLSTNGSGSLAWADAGSGGSSSASSYPNSTVSTMPGSAGDYDLGKNTAQDTAESPFEAGGSDAFGVNLGTVYSMMDPAGTTTTVDLGTLS